MREGRIYEEMRKIRMNMWREKASKTNGKKELEEAKAMGKNSYVSREAKGRKKENRRKR